ncbi:MAG: trigger factor [Anaerolineae bacterium]
MKVSKEKLENCQFLLEIELDEAQVENYLRRTARRLSQKLAIPGFRRGKAPYPIVARFVGQEALFQEALEEMSEGVLEEALKESDLKPIAQVHLEDYQMNPPILKIVVPVAPVVDPGPYRDIRLGEVEEPTVSEEEIASALEKLRHDNVEVRPVERPAQLGDLALVDILGKVDERVIFDDEELEISLGENHYPLPGFGEALVGMSIGEERTFILIYPPDSGVQDLAGQEIQFKVRLHDLKEKILPELDDDLARAANCSTLVELKEKIRGNLQAKAKEEAEERFYSRLWDEVEKGAKVEFPSVFLERELDDLVEERDRYLRANYRLTLENYLNMIKKSAGEFRSELRPEAERRLRRTLILEKIAELEGLEPTTEDMESEIESLSESFQEEVVRQALSSSRGRAVVRKDLLRRMAFERLVAIAKGQAPPLPQKEAEGEAEQTEPEGPAIAEAEEAKE